MKIEIENRDDGKRIEIPVKIKEPPKYNVITFMWEILKYSYFFIINIIILIIDFFKNGKL